jgi:hypothetical protein
MEAARDWIDGVDFPMTKIDLIDSAEEAGAPNEVIQRLQQLTREQYESRAELEGELGDDS